MPKQKDDPLPLLDHYATLGVALDAPQDEIKRRYRGLARQFHPDVNPLPDAAQKIKVINEAYHVLGDPERRATYDAERMLEANAKANAPRPPQPSPTSQNRPKPGETKPSSQARPSFEFNGFGRVTTGQAPSTRPTTSASPVKTPVTREETKRKTDRLIAEAQLAYVNRRYREAEEMCAEILTLDRRNAVAHEVLGDVLMKRGQKAAAELHYSYSVQFNPNNRSVGAKLEKLMGNRPASSPGPTMARPSPATSPREAFSSGINTEATMTMIAVLLSIGFAGIMLLLYNRPGEPIFPGFLSSFSLQMVLGLGVNGVIAGILLSFYGGLRPAGEELFSRDNLRGDQQTTASMGVILAGFALVWFYASALIYIGVAFARNRLSPSILRIYGATLVLTCLFSVVSQSASNSDSTLQLIALGGNLLFPAMILGWLVGDVVRLRGR